MTKGGTGKKGHFLVVYGSQTGQAKAIAEELTEVAASKGLSPALFCFSDFEKKFSFDREKYIAIVCSTTGVGEPPDTVVKFWRRVKRTTLPSNHLAHIHFAFLGLGDSNYNNFCVFGKQLERRLDELGAQRFAPSRWADDAMGLEVEAEPWMDCVIESLSSVLLEQPSPSAVVAPSSTKSCTDSKLISDMQQQQQPTSGLSTDSNCSVVEPNGVVPVDSAAVDMSVAVAVAVSSDSLSAAATVSQHQPTADTSSARNEMLASHSSPAADSSDLIISPQDSKNAAVPQQHAPLDVAVSDSCADLTSQLVESLGYSLPPLSEIAVTVPLCPARFLKVSFLSNENSESVDCASVQNGCPFSGARTPICSVPITSARRLTSGDNVKKTLEIELDVSSCGWSYDPGDTIGVVCPNNLSEVERLIARLGLTVRAHDVCSLEVLADTKKRNAALPEHLPPRSTLVRLLQTCCEIREVPRKAFLRALVDFTSAESERRRLQELCSKQGADHYARFIRQPGICLLDLLETFPSCQPPVDVLFEHLPRLLPRPYSVASSPLDTADRLRFLFNVIEVPPGDSRYASRRGVCTGWLSEIVASSLSDAADDVSDRISTLTLDLKPPTIDIFLRTNNFFRLPGNLETPVIMVGPGTGIAPFVGFIKHRDRQVSPQQNSSAPGETGAAGEMWLFYGCRYSRNDYLYRSEILDWESRGVLTKACVSFSRDVQSTDSPSPRYVQDNIRLHGEHLASLICNKDAVVYVCGDAAGMSPQIHATFKDVLTTHQGMDESAASSYLTMMRLKKRYLEDIWV